MSSPAPAPTPAKGGWKRRMADGLERAHLLAPAVRLYEAALGLRGTLASRRREADGLPLPPAPLRVRVGPSFGDAETFLATGRQHAHLVRALLEQQGTVLEQTAPVLDFGCGVGRVARHWGGVDLDLHGCDVNRALVDWCRSNVPFGRFQVNELAPPLPYGDAAFGLAYAFSVFTHLPEDLQHRWVAEFRRVVRPGGYLLFSTLGDYYVSLDRLRPAERQRFERGELVVLFEEHAGENLCSAYHPRSYVEGSLARGFEYVRYQRGSDAEQHDMHLLRKP